MTRRTSPRRAPNTRGTPYVGNVVTGPEARRAQGYQLRKNIAQNASPPEGKVWCPTCFSAVRVDALGNTHRHKIPGSMRGAICEGGTVGKEDTMCKLENQEYAGRHRADVELVYENIYGAHYQGKHRLVEQ